MDLLLGLASAGLAVVFVVWIVTTAARYVKYRKLRPATLLTWEGHRPWFFGLCLGIGFFMLVLTFVSGFILHRPAIHVVSQGLMALFYTVFFPLGFRIRKGFYRAGIWSERGFVPYRSIRWVGWKEKPVITLAMRMEEGFLAPNDAFLVVPGDHYGEARRILADRIQDGTLVTNESVLGLNTVEGPK